MKVTIIALAALLAAASAAPATAQQSQARQPRAGAERGDPAQRIERRVQMLTERLDLSAEQAAKVKAILTREGEQLKAAFQNGDQGQRARTQQGQAQFQQVREHTNSEIAKVLNAEQRRKYDELKQQKVRPGERRANGPARRT